MIKLGLIGYGYWGPNLFRNFQKLKNCEIDYIIDSDLSKLNELKKNILNYMLVIYWMIYWMILILIQL